MTTTAAAATTTITRQVALGTGALRIRPLAGSGLMRAGSRPYATTAFNSIYHQQSLMASKAKIGPLKGAQANRIKWRSIDDNLATELERRPELHLAAPVLWRRHPSTGAPVIGSSGAELAAPDDAARPDAARATLIIIMAIMKDTRVQSWPIKAVAACKSACPLCCFYCCASSAVVIPIINLKSLEHQTTTRALRFHL